MGPKNTGEVVLYNEDGEKVEFSQAVQVALYACEEKEDGLPGKTVMEVTITVKLPVWRLLWLRAKLWWWNLRHRDWTIQMRFGGGEE